MAQNRVVQTESVSQTKTGIETMTHILESPVKSNGILLCIGTLEIFAFAQLCLELREAASEFLVPGARNNLVGAALIENVLCARHYEVTVKVESPAIQLFEQFH